MRASTTTLVLAGAAVACFAAALAGCFAPEYPGPGLGCPDGVCPPGQTCASGVCVVEESPDGGDGPDAAPPPDAEPCAPWTWSPSNFDPCDPAIPRPIETLVLPAGGGPMDIAVWAYYTNEGMLASPDLTVTAPRSALVAQAGGGLIRVVSLTGLAIEPYAVLVAVGDYPLVLSVHGDVTIDGGAVIVSAVRTTGTPPTLPGAGGNDPVACASAAGGAGSPAGSATAGGGGGGGGAFGGDGGDGSDGAAAGSGMRGQGGVQVPPSAGLSPLRGGCSGGAGGGPMAAPASGGTGGDAAGALQIAAHDSLRVMSGAGIAGLGGAGLRSVSLRGGGGGGGSGGAILLEAGSLMIDGTTGICANGGSGGEGNGAADLGADGGYGSCSETTPASTVAQSAGGGDGGAGGFLGNLSGGSGGAATDGGGGGGGGGAAGRIRLRGVYSTSVDNAAIISPTPVP